MDTVHRSDTINIARTQRAIILNYEIEITRSLCTERRVKSIRIYS